jgi:hypothetical protein
MGKNKDLIQILIIVIIGVLIPFTFSITINFDLDITKIDNFSKIITTFGWFLLIFGIELIVVYIYYQITNKIASSKLEKFKHK